MATPWQTHGAAQTHWLTNSHTVATGLYTALTTLSRGLRRAKKQAKQANFDLLIRPQGPRYVVGSIALSDYEALCSHSQVSARRQSRGKYTTRTRQLRSLRGVIMCMQVKLLQASSSPAPGRNSAGMQTQSTRHLGCAGEVHHTTTSASLSRHCMRLLWSLSSF
jgi:hypothetical protein